VPYLKPHTWQSRTEEKRQPDGSYCLQVIRRREIYTMQEIQAEVKET
jgi:hypothetical protein